MTLTVRLAILATAEFLYLFALRVLVVLGLNATLKLIRPSSSSSSSQNSKTAKWFWGDISAC